MTREYVDYVRDMLAGLDKAEQFTQGVDFEAFATNDEKTFAVIRALEIIGEAARNIPDTIRDQYSEVPWREVTGMRDKLIHAYFGVNLRRVWDTLQNDLPALRPVLTRMLTEAESAETDDSEPLA